MKAISLFSGAGGDTLGMINSGIDVIGFVECDEYAIKTHETNFPNCVCIGKDITKIKDTEFEKYTGNIDIIFGGFPCQSFSHGGKKNATDKRGFLYQEFVRCVSIIKPKIIIGENVKGLLSRKDPEGRLFIDRITEDFHRIGYTIDYTLFNMKNHGIPQDRQRVIIYGIKNDLKLNLENIEKENIQISIENVLEYSLENALKIEREDVLNILRNKNIFTVPPDIVVTGKAPTNLIKCYNSGELSYKKRSKSTYSCIVDKSDIARTILATYGRMPRLFVPVKQGNSYFLRPFTTRELARIQGFPDTFIFSGKYLSIVTQIGNAIPPVFVNKLCNYIVKHYHS